MKGTYYFILILLAGVATSCNNENSWDCLQTAGDIVQRTYEVPEFSKIRIEDDVALEIQQGPNRSVIVESGENLFNEISVDVRDGVLVFTNANGCNLARDFRITRAIVTTPELTEIRNSSVSEVVSREVLRFPRLHLISNTTAGPENPKKSGDFSLEIEAEFFAVEANGFSNFHISGTVEEAVISFGDEIPRFEGPDLIVQELIVFHRSANKMIVNPRQKIEGTIQATGDVIAVHRPPVVNVEELFTGRLIFVD